MKKKLCALTDLHLQHSELNMHVLGSYGRDSEKDSYV